MRNNKGFTLIELLIALALLVILAGALYGTYFSVVAAREKGGTRMEERRELSTTLGKLHNELASCFFNKKNERLLFVVENQDSFGKPKSRLAFTTLTPPRIDPAPASDVMLVDYFVREQNDGQRLTLMREARSPYLDVSVKSTPYPVIDEIEGFLVECWDGAKWVKVWDTGKVNGIPMNSFIPKQVRVTVTLKGGEVFSTIAAQRLSE
ncbi:type II secretion system protein GspJ [Geomonas paludis]|uniref:Type II secretion system protein J n=1 Tax=Geomonas paludis TaxID=2740185 RepID=A0A6V8MTN4_9BACT|nr:type II secretion system protein GspJ [Geomonas paludis]UPU35457.1 type II secretion system protein GspJ [Geomonas paludis]GFO62973.1 general secretion pathway protein GspJ [Geomonas paludis]